MLRGKLLRRGGAREGGVAVSEFGHVGRDDDVVECENPINLKAAQLDEARRASEEDSANEDQRKKVVKVKVSRPSVLKQALAAALSTRLGLRRKSRKENSNLTRNMSQAIVSESDASTSTVLEYGRSSLPRDWATRRRSGRSEKRAYNFRQNSIGALEAFRIERPKDMDKLDWLLRALDDNTALAAQLMLSQDTERWAELADAVRSNSSLAMLEVTGTNSLPYALGAVESHDSISDLKLNNIEVSVGALMNALEASPALCSLAIHLSDLTNETFCDLLGANLERLDVSGNNLGPSLEIPAFQMSLCSLGLRANNIGFQGCKSLAKACEFLPHLEHLDLGGNPIGTKGCKYLAKLLRAGSLHSLDLSYAPIGFSGCEYIANALSKACSLEKLDVMCCDIGVRGCDALMDVLEVQGACGLLSLNIGGASPMRFGDVYAPKGSFHIGSEGCSRILTMLLVNDQLTSLTVAYGESIDTAIALLSTLVHIPFAQRSAYLEQFLFQTANQAPRCYISDHVTKRDHLGPETVASLSKCGRELLQLEPVVLHAAMQHLRAAGAITFSDVEETLNPFDVGIV
mmetsp:Transcript_19477/g.36001  ORF Transcript_19477/g.36001 Transcript_19477/m.36001 type:complete len:573 (-) Transcript_19477:39-1757(-)